MNLSFAEVKDVIEIIAIIAGAFWVYLLFPTLGNINIGLSLAAIKDIVEIAAIIVGGFWAYMLFIKKREKYPRAVVSQHINHLELTDNELLIHVSIEINNHGTVLLPLKNIEVRLQQILPTPNEIIGAIKAGRQLIVDGELEIEWPLIESYERCWEKRSGELEPGERENVHADFVIDKKYKVIEVYSYVKNICKKGEMGWGCTSIYNIEKGECLNEPRDQEKTNGAKA